MTRLHELTEQIWRATLSGMALRDQYEGSRRARRLALRTIQTYRGPQFGRQLGTNCEQHWQRQPHAATMRKHQGGDVRALDLQTSSTTATCFQCHDYGRRTGLKIRSSQEGVGSSPTFGAEIDYFFSTTRILLGATTEVVPSKRSSSSAAGPWNERLPTAGAKTFTRAWFQLRPNRRRSDRRAWRAARRPARAAEGFHAGGTGSQG